MEAGRWKHTGVESRLQVEENGRRRTAAMSPPQITVQCPPFRNRIPHWGQFVHSKRPFGVGGEVDGLIETDNRMCSAIFVKETGQSENQSFDAGKRMNEGDKNYSFGGHCVPVRVQNEALPMKLYNDSDLL
jgi:hypothetical protein